MTYHEPMDVSTGGNGDEPPSLEGWRLELRRQGYARNTVVAKVDAVSLAARHAGVAPHELTRAHILAWVGDGERAAWTRAKYLSHVKAWCAWAGIPDATDGVKRPRLPAGLPRPLGEDELGRLLASLEADRRVRGFVVLGAYAGLRSAETAMVRGDDLVSPAGAPMLHVVGKGGVEALLPAAPIVAETVRELAAGRAGRIFPDTSPRAVQGAIRRAGRRVGVEVSSHMLRHRYGTMLYAGGRDLLMVQQLMRHTSPATTAGYAKVADDAAAAAVRALPVAVGDGERPRLYLVR